MELINSKIDQYLLSITPKRDDILTEMERFARAHHFPIVGPLVGRLLFSIARISGARRVLELGSGFGYSAYWFAKALGKRGEVICTEGNPRNIERARDYFRRGKIRCKVRFFSGDALDSIDTTTGAFDIIFNDIDKRYYPQAFRKALPRLRKGGILISDNVLWSGRVLGAKPDADTQGILRYTRLISSSTKLHTTVIPLRDGVSITIKG